MTSSPRKTTEQYYRRVRQNKSQGRHPQNFHSQHPHPRGRSRRAPLHSSGVVSAHVSGRVPSQTVTSSQVGGVTYVDYDDEEGEVSMV